MQDVSKNYFLNQPCRSKEDVKDSVLPKSHWQASKEASWRLSFLLVCHSMQIPRDSSLHLLEATVTGLLCANDTVSIGRDEITMAVTYQEAKEHLQGRQSYEKTKERWSIVKATKELQITH